MIHVDYVVGHDPAIDRDGIGDYAEQVAAALGRRATLGSKIGFVHSRFKPASIFKWFGFLRFFNRSNIVHIQYPVEGWGTSVMPGVVPVIGRLFFRSSRLAITLHEWRSMHVLRRASVYLTILLADVLIFASERERKAFLSSRIAKYTRSAQQQVVIPIAVNVDIPELETADILAARESALSRLGLGRSRLGHGESARQLVLGFFGFVYEWKQPEKMLHIVKALLNKGCAVNLVMCGDFPDGHDEKRENFRKKIAEYRLEGNVELCGYVERADELALRLSACDVVLQLFSDGLSARRGSFWYSAELGTQVLSTFPGAQDEFEQCGTGYEPSNDERVLLVPADDDPANIAARILDWTRPWSPPVRRTIAPTWDEIAAQHEGVYAAMMPASQPLTDELVEEAVQPAKTFGSRSTESR
ncbi:glycosyltransferase [Paraburkholderia sp. RL17-383-BIF-A]|jgi:glycosyltransferase involved in cell wall biosynthesis|uniref:glycosyltransferase n=1 Tax=Paraburkholderia sp. RL17-383-BIF-A TaxID=3031631 RepID=UPI0038B8364B